MSKLTTPTTPGLPIARRLSIPRPKVNKSLVKDWPSRLKRPAPQVVNVTWMDACHATAARFDLKNPNWDTQGTFGVINQTVGWLLTKNEKWVVLAMEIDEYGYVRDVTDIPTSIVLNIEILKDSTNE